MSIVSDAQSLIGKVRYEFGANNVIGGVADCSSFTQYVYAKNGINIGRDTEAQYNKGTSVSKSDLQAGDLVFFRNTYLSGNTDGVSHVGIYIGNGQFIHNSSSKGVTTNNLSDTYYREHYLGAKRVTTSTTATGTSGGSTINPTYTADEISTGDSSKLDILGQLVKFVCLVGLIILALVFLFNGLGVSSPVSMVTDKMKKGSE